jgi:hypothetical protein
MNTDTQQHTVTDEHMRVVQARKVKQRRVYRIVVVLFVLMTLSSSLAVYFGYEAHVLKNLLAAKEKMPSTPEEITAAVAKHIILSDDTPQIASIQDVEKLKTVQPFFKDALNGDVVIVSGERIILYRPDVDVLVNVGDISSTTTGTTTR